MTARFKFCCIRDRGELDLAVAAGASAVDVPVWLAGGLGPSNVARAISAVRPFGVDVYSGLRTDEGALDPVRLAAFAEAIP